MRDYMIRVEDSVLEASGWVFRYQAQGLMVLGPFPTRAGAECAREQLFRRWADAARARGGWLWRATRKDWRVTLPESQVVGLAPLRSQPCTVHGA